MLAMAPPAMPDPDVVLLDEPLMGLAKILVDEMFRISVACALRKARLASVPDLRSGELAAIGIKRAPGRRASSRATVEE